MLMKGLKSYIITGIIFVSIIGTLLHFAYEWSGNNIIVGIFSPINESIWEHTKLIFFPMMLYSYFISKKIISQYPCINSSMIIGAFTGVLLIIALFYTYSGIIGFHIGFVDISIFFISVILAFLTAYKKSSFCNKNRYVIFLKIIQTILVCLYVLFTFFPPEIPLFFEN